MKKLISIILSIAIVLLALPYLSSGTSVFMAKWAYDWGLPVPAVKLILLAVASLILLGIFSIVKKAVVILIIAVLVLVGLNALGLYNLRTDPKDIVAQVSEVASKNSETIVTASKDLFYQTVSYVNAVNPVETVTEFVSGDDSFWYMSKKDETVDFSQEIFSGYEVEETKEVGDFKAYHLKKTSN
ncbi:hypothetical protein IKF81_02425 [Candidatus Saccharibacteria bacterium]|nr:hypothetical protein [Candidatus Saccharibacteria bacterium]